MVSVGVRGLPFPSRPRAIFEGRAHGLLRSSSIENASASFSSHRYPSSVSSSDERMNPTSVPSRTVAEQPSAAHSQCSNAYRSPQSIGSLASPSSREHPLGDQIASPGGDTEKLRPQRAPSSGASIGT